MATSALIKLSGLPGKYINATVMEEFIAQAHDFGSYNLERLDQLTKMLSFMEPMHPWTTLRTAELLKWIDSGEYQTLLSGKSPEKKEEVEEWDFLTSW